MKYLIILFIFTALNDAFSEKICADSARIKEEIENSLQINTMNVRAQEHIERSQIILLVADEIIKNRNHSLLNLLDSQLKYSLAVINKGILFMIDNQYRPNVSYTHLNDLLTGIRHMPQAFPNTLKSSSFRKLSKTIKKLE